MLTIGKSDTVVQVLPAGLRFWEKLGLGPRSGQKNVTAFMFFEGGGDEREVQMEQWLEQVSATYTVRFSRVQLTLPAHKNYRPKITGRIYPEIVIVVSDLVLYPCTLTLSGRHLVLQIFRRQVMFNANIRISELYGILLTFTKLLFLVVKDFINRLLDKNPDTRMSTADALQHEVMSISSAPWNG